MTKPKVLVATPIAEGKLYLWDEWVESLKAQDAEVVWDLVLVDNTDYPSPGYLDWLREWVRSKPFGNGHRIRLKRFGPDVDGTQFLHPIMKVTYADRQIWEWFSRWTRYDYLFWLECDVLMRPDCLRKLMESELDWAAAWMLSRPMQDPRQPEKGWHRIPLLWHTLDLEHWQKCHDWQELITYGYMEPPSEEPFPCVVTHLGATLMRGDVVRSIPFPMANAGGDVTYSWAAKAHGVQPMCVPVPCDHVAEVDRPNARPPHQLQEVT